MSGYASAISYNKNPLVFPDLGSRVISFIKNIGAEYSKNEIDLFFSYHGGACRILSEVEKYSKIYGLVADLIEGGSNIWLENRAGARLSPQQLRSRAEPGLFVVTFGPDTPANQTSPFRVTFMFDEIANIQCEKENWQLEAERFVIADVTRTLQRRGYEIGLNPYVKPTQEGAAQILVDIYEGRDFVNLVCEEAAQRGNWGFANSKGKELTPELLVSRKEPADFYIRINIVDNVPIGLVVEIAVRFGKKVAEPEKSKSIVNIADSGAARSLYESICAKCEEVGITFIRGGSLTDRLRINIHQDLAPSLRKIITNVMDLRSDIVLLDTKGKIISPAVFGKLDFQDPFDVAVILSDLGGTLFVAPIEVAYWMVVVRPERTITACNRSSGRAARVSDFATLSGFGDLNKLGNAFTDPMLHNFPIDVVYTWVNDQDEAWQAERAKYEEIAGINNIKSKSTSGRFKNRNELKYSIRSICMFAPFVRNIYIVTSGQIPDWLDLSQRRVKIISHKDIFSDVKNTPTFNSHSIESRLHHIPGLSENFIYFNDDMMLGNYCVPSDFFESNGLAKIRPEPLYIVPELISNSDAEYIHAGKRVVNLFRSEFGVSPSNTMHHIPYSVKKSVMAEMEDKFTLEFQRTEGHRFRSVNDISPISFFYCHYAYYTKRAVIGESSHKYIPLWAKSALDTLNDVLATRKYKFLCLNDSGSLNEDMEMVDNAVRQFLESYYPIKSEFEH